MEPTILLICAVAITAALGGAYLFVRWKGRPQSRRDATYHFRCTGCQRRLRSVPGRWDAREVAPTAARKSRSPPSLSPSIEPHSESGKKMGRGNLARDRTFCKDSGKGLSGRGGVPCFRGRGRRPPLIETPRKHDGPEESHAFAATRSVAGAEKGAAKAWHPFPVRTYDHPCKMLERTGRGCAFPAPWQPLLTSSTWDRTGRPSPGLFWTPPRSPSSRRPGPARGKRWPTAGCIRAPWCSRRSSGRSRRCCTG